MSRLAIIAALPREIAPLVRGVTADRAMVSKGIHLYQLPGAVVVTAGMGAERAAFAVEVALASGKLTGLISVGLAGSCRDYVQPGMVMEAALVVDVRTGERFQCAQNAGQVLATTGTIASVHEKTRLAETYGATMVDMEAATVARFAQAHGLMFRAIKGISDAHDFEIASLSRFATAEGKFRTGRFALHTALRPHRWKKTIRLGRSSAAATAALNGCLVELLAQGSTAANS